MPRRRQEIGCQAPASQSTKVTGNESLKLGTENWEQQPKCPSTTGKNPTDEYLEGMMNEAPGPINFTMFLTMFGEKLNGTDPEDVIRNAFACFDEEASGFIHEDHLRELLTTMGDRFTDEEVDEMYREAPIDKKGNFNYVEFTRILKHGAKDKDD